MGRRILYHWATREVQVHTCAHTNVNTGVAVPVCFFSHLTQSGSPFVSTENTPLHGCLRPPGVSGLLQSPVYGRPPCSPSCLSLSPSALLDGRDVCAKRTFKAAAFTAPGGSAGSGLQNKGLPWRRMLLAGSSHREHGGCSPTPLTPFLKGH